MTGTPERERECSEIRAGLPEKVAEETRRSAAAAGEIHLMLAAAGVEFPPLTADPGGLARLEELLFQVAGGAVEVPREEFEELAAFFFAQVLIERAGARWDIHDVCTEKWRPYVILRAGDRRLGVHHLVRTLYAKDSGTRPKRALTKLLRDLSP